MKNVVVLIGGKGTSGKSTFISYVQEILGANKCQEFSTIDPVKEIVEFMRSLEEAAIMASLGLSQYQYHLDPSPLAKEITEKTDKYRSLLHDIKMIWCDVDDGPNVITFGKVQHFFTNNGEIAFVNCREPEQFAHIIDTLSKSKPEWTIVTLNIIRDGAGDTITNQGDQDTNNFKYDITINNNGTLEDLKNKAKAFVDEFYF
jgi:dephospho-CoA kinase